MTLSRKCGLSLGAALLLACSSDGVIGPSSRFDNAAARFACGPADGPALEIYLSENPLTAGDPPGAFVRVYVPGPVEQIVGKLLPIAGNSDVSAWFQSSDNVYQPDASNFEAATSGYLMINSGSASQALDGSVDIQFPKAGHLQRAFHANWIPTVVLCA